MAKKPANTTATSNTITLEAPIPEKLELSETIAITTSPEESLLEKFKRLQKEHLAKMNLSGESSIDAIKAKVEEQYKPAEKPKAAPKKTSSKSATSKK